MSSAQPCHDLRFIAFPPRLASTCGLWLRHIFLVLFAQVFCHKSHAVAFGPGPFVFGGLHVEPSQDGSQEVN